MGSKVRRHRSPIQWKPFRLYEHHIDYNSHVLIYCSAHLPYLIQSPHYEITALCNSSVKSAEAAIKRHSLPSSTKAYGSPEELAKDPNVDLVVCSVRVDRHYALTMPALKAGKAAFVEWPLGSNLQQAEEMLAAAKNSGSQTIVSLQSRISPYIQKVKNLVESKRVGELLSSNLTYVSGTPGDVSPPGIDYLVCVTPEPSIREA
jgi:predicted dehydrogenase